MNGCVKELTWKREDDQVHFACIAGVIRASAEPLLTEMFGERCESFSESCECCRRWKLLDELLQNPFDE